MVYADQLFRRTHWHGVYTFHLSVQFGIVWNHWLYRWFCTDSLPRYGFRRINRIIEFSTQTERFITAKVVFVQHDFYCLDGFSLRHWCECYVLVL